jgi:hypothetical protein
MIEKQINDILIYSVTSYYDKETLKTISSNQCDGILHKPLKKDYVDKVFERYD